MTAYYNEIDPKAAAWLRELIKQGHIAPGDVDERSISDVTPKELFGYTQCHFFAGVGVWSYALRKSGWPDDRPVWTGSCPCQPFSSAGKRKGTSDERHLWPHWFHLISQCRPIDVFGEQVASKDGRSWFDTVQADMEALGFAVGAADLCAAGIGAPHIRQRLWFYGTVADASGKRRERREGAAQGGVNDRAYAGRIEGHDGFVGISEACTQRMADASDDRPQGRLPGWQDTQRQMVNGSAGRDSATQRVADAPSRSGGDEWEQRSGEHGLQPQDGGAMRAGYKGSRVGLERVADDQLQQRQIGTASDNETRGRNQESATIAGYNGNNTTHPTNGNWRNADWLGCRDGKFRPVGPGTFPLVNGAAARVGRLRGYGNAIVAQVAQTFIEATQGE